MTNENCITEDYLRDCEGNYYHLEISILYRDISVDIFLPDEIDYPDAYRYSVIKLPGKYNEFKELSLIEDIKEKQIVVKKLKEIHGIKDPWDDDPEYFIKKLKILKSKVETLNKEPHKYLKNSRGTYYFIKYNLKYENVSKDDIEPDNFIFPDASVYEICSSDEGQEIIQNIEDIEFKDIIVKMLKKIHGIKDYWDKTPNILEEEYWQEKLGNNK